MLQKLNGNFMNCEICGTELIPDECSQPICYDCYNSEAYADWEWKQTHKNMNTDGIARIAAERNRQIKDHGFTLEHDDGHYRGDLAIVAACYAAHSVGKKIFIHEELEFPLTHRFADPFPWDELDDARRVIDNTKQRIRLLEKAGALIAAEIDRLIRNE